MASPVLSEDDQGDDHCPGPAATPLLSQARMPLASWPPGHSVAHVQLLLSSTPSTFPSRHLCSPSAPGCSCRGCCEQGQEQAQALGLVGPQSSGLSPSVQPVQMPLQSLPALQQLNTATQLAVSAGCLRVPWIPSCGSLIKTWNRAVPALSPGQHCWLQFHSPAASGPGRANSFTPIQRSPSQAMSSQFLQEMLWAVVAKAFLKSR